MLLVLLSASAWGQSVADVARRNGKAKEVAGKTFSNVDQTQAVTPAQGSQSADSSGAGGGIAPINAAMHPHVLDVGDAAEFDATYSMWLEKATDLANGLCGAEAGLNKPESKLAQKQPKTQLARKQLTDTLENLTKLIKAESATVLMAMMFDKAHGDVEDRAQYAQGTGTTSTHKSHEDARYEKYRPMVDEIQQMNGQVKALYDRCGLQPPQ